MFRRVVWLILVVVAIPAVLTGGSPGCGVGGSSESTPGDEAMPTAEGSPETDKEALVAFYNATNIFDWLSGSTWHVNDPLVLWPGVSTDNNGRVTGLRFTGLGDLGDGLRGELPAELGNLSMLETLRLDQHLLSGGIPPELGRLSNLKLLSLRDNGLSGPIPKELGNLNSLERLNLSYNRLSGEIPPELGDLSSLENLDLSYNQLAGEIPAELGNLAGLEWLSLAWNQLSGEIPAELWNLTNAYLSLSPNQSGWCVPADQLGRWKPHESVDLADCGSPGLATATPAATRPPPTATATPYPTLTLDAMLDREALVALYNAAGGDNWSCNDNWLSDKPLSTWCFVETDAEGRVVALSLNGVNLSGEIPPELGNLANLERLDLRDNQLSGVIPSELGNLSRLEYLYLDHNNLSGEIPPELGNLSNLRGLRIYGVWELIGCIPAALQSQLDMERSILPDLPFCGDALTPYPVATATAAPVGKKAETSAETDREALVALYNATGGDRWNCNDNWLSDKPLSTWCHVDTDEERGMGDEGRVVTLILYDNNLRGEIPSELVSLENLVALDLGRNKLSGVIPPDLGSLSSLTYLDLSWNNLSGEIPAELARLSNLTVLHLDLNELSGAIPSELGNLSRLEALYLHDNNLSGDIPPELGNLSNLEELRLDGTHALSGCVPAVLESQLDMRRSDLQDMPFCGDASTPYPVATATAAPEGTRDVELPWTQDGLTAIEREALGYLEMIRQDDLVYEALLSRHPWLSSGIGEEERRFLCLVASIPDPDVRYVTVVAEEPSADLPECGTSH